MYMFDLTLDSTISLTNVKNSVFDAMMFYSLLFSFLYTQAAVVILNRGTPTDFIQTILQECCSLLLNKITLTRHEESETRLFFERVQERKLGL